MAEFASGRLRGFALDWQRPYSAQDMTDLAATGCNVVRWSIILRRDPASPRYLPADLAPTIDLLQRCAPLGIRVIVVLCPIPHGHASEWWANPDLQQDITAQWVHIARALKNFPALQAYDIINEPVGAPVLPGDGTSLNEKSWWLSIAQVICDAIRRVDTQTPLMVESSGWAQVGHFWRSNAVKATGLVASFHWYEPRPYAYQGIDGHPVPCPLPPTDLSENLLEARKFVARYNVPMFVGEFNAVRWAPQSDVWLERMTRLFAAEKWGWTVHAWRAWEGWDVEIPGSVAPFHGKPADRRADTPALLAIKRGISA